MRVIYLFNIDGWALEDIGLGLRDALSGVGIEVEVIRADRWFAEPTSADVLYLSWSGMVKPGRDLHRFAPRVVTTIHDPQEISHFENRADWPRWPLRPLHWLDAVDRVSVISRELREAVARGYGLDAPRTPTWPSRWRHLHPAQDRREGRSIKAVATTNLDPHHSWGRVFGRLRHWSGYVVDSHHRLSLRQLAGLGVRRRRKNIPALRRLAARCASRPGLSCDFHWGRPRFSSRAAYEAWLTDADVYVCASTMEGGPLPVMEAVLSGLAVVTTPVGQVGDWVEDGRNGFVVDTAAGLERALAAYAADPGMLRRHQGVSAEIGAAFRPSVAPWVEFLAPQRIDNSSLSIK